MFWLYRSPWASYPVAHPGWRVFRDSDAFGWRLWHGVEEGRHSCIVPLWPLVVLASITTGLSWQLDLATRRSAKLNLCPKCGYDRAGIARDAKCPECGAAPAGV